jgi:hypothetical protein
LFDSILAAEFGPRRPKLVREEMIRLGWSRHYINDSIGRIKRMFTWSAWEELVPADIAMALRTVQGLQKDRTAAGEKPPVGPVADEHVEAVLPVLPAALAHMVRVQRLTRMRPGEFLPRTAGAIDRGNLTCWVCEADGRVLGAILTPRIGQLESYRRMSCRWCWNPISSSERSWS